MSISPYFPSLIDVKDYVNSAWKSTKSYGSRIWSGDLKPEWFTTWQKKYITPLDSRDALIMSGCGLIAVVVLAVSLIILAKAWIPFSVIACVGILIAGFIMVRKRSEATLSREAAAIVTNLKDSIDQITYADKTNFSPTEAPMAALKIGKGPQDDGPFGHEKEAITDLDNRLTEFRRFANNALNEEEFNNKKGEFLEFLKQRWSRT